MSSPIPKSKLLNKCNDTEHNFEMQSTKTVEVQEITPEGDTILSSSTVHALMLCTKCGFIENIEIEHND